MPSRMDRALANAGAVHERRVLSRLAALAGVTPLTVPRGVPDRYQITASALSDGIPIIHQPALTDGELLEGYGDILLRNSHNPFLSNPDDFPEDGYSVIEVKLASTVEADYALQAAAYTDMLKRATTKLGLPVPAPPLLWLGTAAEAPTALPPVDAAYFYSSVRTSYAAFLESFDPKTPLPPIDAPLRDLSPWEGAVHALLVENDSILQVAGARRVQVRALERAGIHTMEQLANMSIDQIISAVDSIGRAPLEALQKQAELQVASRTVEQPAPPVFELVRSLPQSAPTGLHRLPPHCRGDVFFDMEGFPLVPGGLEYLFGAVEAVGDGVSKGEFHAWWAHDRREEESQCAAFVNWLWERWHQWGKAMHVYHYGHYEITALRRVTNRALSSAGAIAGQRLEEMIDEGLFVDIYKLVKASLRIGEPSYSIKNVEKLVGVSREGDGLADAESSVALYYEWRRMVQGSDDDACEGSLALDKDCAANLLQDIELYNQQDCESLGGLVRWLRELAHTHGVQYSRLVAVGSADTEAVAAASVDGKPAARGACGANPERKAADSGVIRYGEQLCIDLLNGDGSDMNKTLAHLTGFHVRESAPARGRFTDRILRAASGDTASLFQDDQCISMIRKSAAPSEDEASEAASRRRPTTFYHCDPMEQHRLAPGDGCALVVVQSRVMANDVEIVDPIAGFVRVREAAPGILGLDLGAKLAKNDVAPVSGAVVLSDELIICPSSMRASITDSVSRIVRDRAGASPLLLSYLQRLGFRDVSVPGDEGRSIEGLDACGRVLRDCLPEVVASIPDRTFIIQGPPGTGKTVTSASLIMELVSKHQKTVAVSSNSHAAIDNLLERAVSAGVPAEHVKKIGPKNPTLEGTGIGRLSTINGTVVAPLSPPAEGRGGSKNAACVVGGTAYALSSQEATGKFDYIFVDEAGQVPMANFIAMAPCAKSAVLVGDQQQLDMPIQGQHPEPMKKSCLTYFVGDDVAIVPPSKGLFLEKSYRMSPPLCSLISRLMYQNALVPAKSTASHAIRTSMAAAKVEDTAPVLGESGNLSGLLFVDRDSNMLSSEGARRVRKGKRHCPSEVALTKRVMNELLGAEFCAKGTTSMLKVSDVMVVAPYNVQVAALQDALPEGSRVGTIDKFQGQEAPVVIVSTCAFPEGDDFDGFNDDSEVASLDFGACLEEELADNHGTWFALQRKRMNVALSRAQCLAVVIGPGSLGTRARARSLEDASVLSFYNQIVESGHRCGQVD